MHAKQSCEVHQDATSVAQAVRQAPPPSASSRCSCIAAGSAQVATSLTEASCAMVFTGAGISTNAGVPDLRGGCGRITRELQGRPPPRPIVYEHLRPTLAHEAVARLVRSGIVAHVVTQNVDGLERLSGVKNKQLHQLRGDAFIERCPDGKCGRTFRRPFCVCDVSASVESLTAAHEMKRDAVRTLYERLDADGSGSVAVDELKEMVQSDVQVARVLGIAGHRKSRKIAATFKALDADGSGDVTFDELCDVLVGPLDLSPADRPAELQHRTGRMCDQCGSALVDTVQSYGDPPPQGAVDSACAAALQTDYTLVLGSSLLVSPAQDIVFEGGRTVMVSTGRTVGEAQVEAKVLCDTDTFMLALMRELLGHAAYTAWRGEITERQPLYDKQREADGELRMDVMLNLHLDDPSKT